MEEVIAAWLAGAWLKGREWMDKPKPVAIQPS